MEAGEDSTLAARPKYATGKAVEITRALPSSYDLPRAAPPRPHLKISLNQDQAIGAGVAALVLIILVLGRC